MGFYPCMNSKLERTADKLIAAWYDSVTGVWVEKEFKRSCVDSALQWLEKAFTAVEM